MLSKNPKFDNTALVRLWESRYSQYLAGGSENWGTLPGEVFENMY